MADKKPKVGDVVGWVVFDKDMDTWDKFYSRERARKFARSFTKADPDGSPYRIAKIVLSK